MEQWVQLPTRWIRESDSHLVLPEMKWTGEKKSDQIAALMIYIVFVHHAKKYTSADLQDVANGITVPFSEGEVALSYSDIQDITGLSRSKISGGLKVLMEHHLIYPRQNDVESVRPLGRKKKYVVAEFGNALGWAKLPARKLYTSGEIRIFHDDFNLRKRTELDALKIYLVILAFRDRSSNSTKIGYDNIQKYTGVNRIYIKAALSFLVVHNLMQVDKELCYGSDDINHNVYRARYIDSYIHAGTSTESFDNTAQNYNNEGFDT